jgi:hypothetical protein
MLHDAVLSGLKSIPMDGMAAELILECSAPTIPDWCDYVFIQNGSGKAE